MCLVIFKGVDILNIEVIKENALKNHVPILLDDTLEVITNILKEIKPRKILEIGTAVGYSAICFEKYVEEKIDTIERDEDRFEEATKNVKALNLENKINLIKGDAIEILETFESKKEYDFVFIDAAKSKCKIFLEHALRLGTDNVTIVVDNVLYKGYVMSDYNNHKHRTAVRNLREFLKYIEENENLDSKILEVGDGLAIIEKLRN